MSTVRLQNQAEANLVKQIYRPERALPCLQETANDSYSVPDDTGSLSHMLHTVFTMDQFEYFSTVHLQIL